MYTKTQTRTQTESQTHSHRRTPSFEPIQTVDHVGAKAFSGLFHLHILIVIPYLRV